MPSTSPDNIYYPDISAAQNQPGYMGTHATSVQVALSARQRYTYVWANATARNSQTGMTEGSVGYQLDTRTEYQYENGSWRLATPHIEFTATATATNGVVTLAGTFSIDTTVSSSTLMATAASNGVITLTDPGIYAISTLSAIAGTVPVTGRSFLDLATTSNDTGLLIRSSINVGEDKGSISMPNLRVTGSGVTLYFKLFQTSGADRSMSTRARITRIG